MSAPVAYYNEIDPFAAAWLRELIAAGHIMPGVVDERSIEDVRPNELRGFTQCHFFAGIGVWSYALRRAGWADDRPVWTGSCPCQPFSAAGKGAGFADERHLWPALHWLIQQCRPAVVIGEQVAGSAGLGWFDVVSADLEACDYAVGAVVTTAAGIAAPHIRQRMYWVANSASEGRRGRIEMAPTGSQKPGGPNTDFCTVEWPDGFGSGSALRVPDVLSSANGSAARVGRLRGYGNAIVAPQAEAFVRALI